MIQLARSLIQGRSRCTGGRNVGSHHGRKPGFSALVIVLAAFLLVGCASMGPGTIGRDRLDYEHAVTGSWQRQLLLNLVKIRYGDTPFFLDVASITNSYGLETQVSVSSSWWWNVFGSGADSSQSLGVAGRYTDKPTITYSPLVGQRFTRSLLTPIPPAVVLSFIQTGWSADGVLRLMVSSVNGVQNRFGGGAQARGADPDFYRLCEALRRTQASGAVGMRIIREREGELTLLTFSGRKSEDVERDQRTVREILGIEPSLQEIRVIYGSSWQGNEIAMLSRSLLEILLDLSSSIDVPASHIDEGRTYQTKKFDSDARGFRQMLRVRSGQDRPANALVAVLYRNYWYWIEDSDYLSKSMFSYLLVLLSLTDTDPGKGAPIITIPAG